MIYCTRVSTRGVSWAHSRSGGSYGGEEGCNNGRGGCVHPTIASAYTGSTGPLGMSLVIPMRALCSFESLVLISGRRVQHTRCTAREKCVHPRAQHLRTPRAARRAQLLYPDVSRAGELVVLYHDHGKHISAEKATPFSLTVSYGPLGQSNKLLVI